MSLSLDIMPPDQISNMSLNELRRRFATHLLMPFRDMLTIDVDINHDHDRDLDLDLNHDLDRDLD
jgi:hypothetical protein